MAIRKVWFSDFWSGFIPEKSEFFRWLNLLSPTVLDRSNPDLLICSVFGNDWMNFTCRKLWYTYERMPPFPQLFDFSMSFEPDNASNLYLPMIRIWPGYGDLFLERDIDVVTWKRRKTVNFIYSNKDPKFRNELFHGLNNSVGVYSGGSAFNNVGGQVTDKSAFLSNHNFTIACENVRWPGYVTEKILDAWCAGTVPIYAGDTEWRGWLNPQAALVWEKNNQLDSIIQNTRLLLEDFDAYRAMYRSPIFPENKEPQLWHQDRILGFIETVISSPKRIRNSGKLSRNYFWSMKDEWFRWRIIHWKNRKVILLWIFLFPLVWIRNHAKESLKRFFRFFESK